MRKSGIILLGLLPGLAQLHAGNNVWTSHGPGQGNVVALAVDPADADIVYISAGSGVVFKSTDGGANWKATGSGLAGFTSVLAIDRDSPETVYALASGLFKSVDGGQSWNPLGTPAGVSTFMLDPETAGTLYAGSIAGVLKSTDGGASWATFNSGLKGAGIGYLAISPQRPRTLYAGVFPRGSINPGAVLRSTDGGVTWIAPFEQKLLALGLPPANTCDTWNYYFPQIMGRPAPPADQLACYPADNRETEITAEQYVTAVQNFAGRRFDAADFGLISNIRSLLVDPFDADTVYALTGRGIFISVDGGLTWNDASPGQSVKFNLAFLTADPANPGTLYAGASFAGRLYKTIDGGFTWNSLSLPGNGGINVLALDPQNSGTMYAGTSFGFFKSTDAASSWISRESGLADASIFSLLVDTKNPGTVYAGVNAGAPSVFKTTDGGLTWLTTDFAASIGGTAVLLAIDPQNSNTLYAAKICCALFKSTDAGATWLPTGLQEFPGTVLVDPRNSNTLYARSGLVGGGIVKSTDGGSTWRGVSSGLGGTPKDVPLIAPFIMDQSSPDILYGVRYSDGQFFRTTDGGAIWSAVNNGWDGKLFHVVALAADPHNSGTLYAGTAEFDCGYGDTCPSDYPEKLKAAGGVGIFKTTDGGQSWRRLNAPQAAGYFGYYVLAVDPVNSNVIYTVADYPSRVLRSSDGGESWSELSARFPDTQVFGFGVDGQNPATIYAGTRGNGVVAITLTPQ